MDLRGTISNLLSLGAKLVPTVVSSAQAPSSSTSPSAEHNHQIQAELEKLMRMLEQINARLYDAEQREIRDSLVKLWLKELKGVAHHAEDVLEEYHYEVFRAQVEARDATPPDSRKRKLIQVPSGMLDQIQQIRSSFDEITNDPIALQLSKGDGPRHCNNQIAQTSHLVDESDIFGRESEKEKLIDLLSSECDGVSVVTIVGMGGIGKTTVAQLAFNDQRIRQRFDKFWWICVSGDFNVERLTRESLESITGSGCSLTNLSYMQGEIQREISGKRILLVLDDVWNENKDLWASFRVPFKSAAVAKILVTTRNDPVAQIMQTETTLHLDYLSAEQCWLLFEHYAFGGVKQNKDPELVEIGKQIMNKCRMLPLAVKSIASLLRHEGEVENWRDILESELWESEVQREIISPLQVSYARLPTYLKSCFLYCSMFPKDYEYDVEELVKLWIAEGFIVSKGNKTAEKIGFEYALQLCERSLFERGITERNVSRRPFFKLHDIVHDLARVNSENSCYSIESGKVLIFPNVLYHLYIANCVKLIDPIPPSKFTDLRTLITGSNFKILNSTIDLSMAPKLRVLNICGSNCGYVISSIVDSELKSLSSIGNLKHLRYLSLRYLSFETLPECICSLYSLQNLTLIANYNLKELPTKIGNLMSLEELIIDHCHDFAVLPESLCQLKALRKLDLFSGKLEVLPSGIWSLTNLQTLKIVGNRLSYLPHSRGQFVGIQLLKAKVYCETIGWLKNFPDLGGALCLNNLDYISNLDAQCANLVSMHNLEDLMLCWGVHFGDYYYGAEGSVLQLIIKCHEKLVVEDQSCFLVMASLQPHPNLRMLKIDGYGGNTFPEWIGSLCKLKYLNIRCCNSLQFLKAESLPLALEKLVIYGCNQLVSISGMEKLKSLVEFYIDKCGKLVSISGMQNLKSLVKVSIEHCWELCSLLGPSLELTMGAQEGSHGSSSLGLTNLCKLKYLTIRCCDSLQFLNAELLPLALENLEIYECNQLVSISGMEKLKSLVEFCIYKCWKLVSISGMQNLKSLVKVSIDHCWELCSLLGPSLELTMGAQEGSHGSSSLGLTNLCKLKYLTIKCCDSLQFLNAELLPLALENLKIYECNQLVSISGMEKLKSLVEFCIYNCWKLVSISGMQNLKSLVKVSINHCSELCSLLGPSLELTMGAQEGSHGSSSLRLINFADDWHPVEPWKVRVAYCPGLTNWCLQNGINFEGKDEEEEDLSETEEVEEDLSETGENEGGLSKSEEDEGDLSETEKDEEDLSETKEDEEDLS